MIIADGYHPILDHLNKDPNKNSMWLYKSPTKLFLVLNIGVRLNVSSGGAISRQWLYLYKDYFDEHTKETVSIIIVASNDIFNGADHLKCKHTVTLKKTTKKKVHHKVKNADPSFIFDPE